MGQRLSLHRTFHRPDGTGSLVKAVAADLRMGRMPHVSSPSALGSWEAMAAGHHDRWLKGIRRQLAAIDRPVFLTFHHEPENDRRAPNRTAADFVAMQTRIIELFERQAPKVTIVPVLMSWTFDRRNPHGQPERWNVPAAKVFGLDIYNPFSSENSAWLTFEQRLRPARRLAGDRPILIGEYGCRNDPDDPTRAATWMREAFATARDGNVVGMSYYHSGLNSEEGPWHLNGRQATVFRNRLDAPAVARLGR